MTAGRPKEHDRVKIGKDLVNWAATNPHALSIPMFATSIGLHSQILRTWCKETPEFQALYMQAKELIGINRFKCTQEGSEIRIDNHLHMKTIHHYDYDIREDNREEKIFDKSLENEQIENAIKKEMEPFLKSIKDQPAVKDVA